jgi:hypothetical protein
MLRDSHGVSKPGDIAQVNPHIGMRLPHPRSQFITEQILVANIDAPTLTVPLGHPLVHAAGTKTIEWQA